MFSESSSRSPSESKTRHKLRRFSASEEMIKIMMMELGTWVQSAKLESGWKVHMGLYFTKLPREASLFL
ncbi:hypothetical protein Tco_0790174 [Tanacetum coccineum]